MNVLTIYSNDQVVTGGHKRHLEAIKQLADRGYKINLFAPSGIVQQGTNIKCYQLKISSSILPYTHKVRVFLGVLFKPGIYKIGASCDIIFLFGLDALIPCLIVSKLLKVPIVYAARGIFKDINYSSNSAIPTLWKIRCTIIQAIEKIAYRNVGRIVVQNSQDQNKLIQRYNISPDCISVLPNNINVSWIDKASSSKKNASKELRHLIFVGSLTQRKGILDLLEAFKEFVWQTSYVETTLSILGHGPLEQQAKQFVSANQLESYVKFYGYVENTVEFIAASDLLVVPSLEDPCPNVVLEAFSVGTPVIGSNVDGIPDLIADNRFLFSPCDCNSLLDRLLSLRKTELYHECKQNSIDQAANYNFDWAGKFEQILSDTAL